MAIKASGHHILVKVDEDLALKEFLKSLKPGEDLVDGWIVSKSSGIKLSKADYNPDAEKHGANTGIVVDMGPEAYDNKPSPWTKIGDKVFFKRYAGPEVKGNMVGEGKEVSYIILNDDDVLAVLN